MQWFPKFNNRNIATDLQIDYPGSRQWVCSTLSPMLDLTDDESNQYSIWFQIKMNNEWGKFSVIYVLRIEGD